MANGVLFRSSEGQDHQKTGFLRMRDRRSVEYCMTTSDTCQDSQELRSNLPTVAYRHSGTELTTVHHRKVMQQPRKDLLATLPVEVCL